MPPPESSDGGRPTTTETTHRSRPMAATYYTEQHMTDEILGGPEAEDKPAPDLDQTISFLRRWAPEGPWALSAIDPDTRKIETRTFYPETEDHCRQFLDKWVGSRNLYFHVNAVRGELSKKAQREDIESVGWFHVDIDPRAGEDIEDEQRRALDMLQDPGWREVPPASVIIFSGGGYQGFWKLSEPIPIGGDLPKAEDAKRYNLHLETQFGGDNCHNIARIMRLPGTINLPDKRKKAKGRVPVLAELVEFHDDRVYDLGQFAKADVVQSPADRGFSDTNLVQLPSGNVERFAVEELQQRFPQVKDRVWVICVQGHHPDEGPKPGDNSRSEWLFDVCCNLARENVPDEVIYSIITDPDYEISASVRDKGSSAEKYALRQINRAKEYAIDPWLAELNAKYAVIGNFHGKCRVVKEERDDTLNRNTLVPMHPADFKAFYCNKPVEVGTDRQGNPINKPVGEWWFKHPQRREYDSLVFAPERDVPGAYNLWRGFAVVDRPGDCSLYLAHVRDHICSGDEQAYNYVISWMARAVQLPAQQGHTAIVLRGERGTGKSVFATEFGSLFGNHFIQVSDPKHLVGSFNAHLRDAVVVFGDEAFYAGDKKHESVLKTLITESFLTIEAKGVDALMAPNFTHMILASNADWVVPAGEHERRYLVLDVSNAKRQDTAYFGAMREQLDNGGREALLHFLKNYDCANFDVRTVPQTSALLEQQEHSADPVKQLLIAAARTGNLSELLPDLLRYSHTAKVDEVATRDLIEKAEDAWPYLHTQFLRDKLDRGWVALSDKAVGSRLAKVLPAHLQNAKTQHRRVRPLGELQSFRQAVTEAFGYPMSAFDLEVEEWIPHPLDQRVPF